MLHIEIIVLLYGPDHFLRANLTVSYDIYAKTPVEYDKALRETKKNRRRSSVGRGNHLLGSTHEPKPL